MEIKDFDAWAALAKSDPDAFERKRKEAIEACIADAPVEYQPRLRGLQFRVDMERSRASNPLSATIRISNMMWAAFSDLRDALDQAVNGAPLAEAQHGRTMAASADVIEFRPRKA